MHPRLRTALVCVADHALPRLPVVLHRGARGSMLVAGPERWSRYLPDRFLGAAARTVERLGTVPVWRLPDVLDRWRPRVDVVVARVDLFSAARFPATRYLRVPEWIRMAAPVPAAGAAFPSSQARRSERCARRHGLTWRISHDRRDLATFIERDYVPYTRLRHGADAHLRSAGWFRGRFRGGGLVWIERGSEPVAGLVYDVRGRSLRRLAAACAGGDASHLRCGGMSATHLACFELARSHGCDEVDMRNCRPCLADGLLHVKHTWGGRIVPPDDLTHDWLVGWHAATPPVMRFLAESPLIVRHGRGFAAVRAEVPGTRPPDPVAGVEPGFVIRADGGFGDWDPVLAASVHG